MAIIDNNNGFIPSTREEFDVDIYNLLLAKLTDGTNNFTLSYNQYLQSNLYRYNYGIISKLIEQEGIMANEIDRLIGFLVYLDTTIGSHKTSTFQGFNNVFQDYTTKFRIWSKAYNPEVPFLDNGEVLIVLKGLTTEEERIIQLQEELASTENFTNSKPKALISTDAEYPDKEITFTLSNNQQKKIYYKEAVEVPIWIKVHFTFLKEGIRPSDITSAIKNALLVEWAKVMTIGSSFLRERYLSTQTVYFDIDENKEIKLDFVENFELEYSLDGTTYIAENYTLTDGLKVFQELTLSTDNITLVEEA